MKSNEQNEFNMITQGKYNIRQSASGRCVHFMLYLWKPLSIDSAPVIAQ